MTLTLEDLREQAGLTAAELARRARISAQTWWRITHGIPVTRESATKILRQLNEELGTSYSLDSIDVNLTD